MALNLPNGQKIHVFLEKGLREQYPSGSCDGSLAKTPDLNLPPPANLSFLWGHPVDMKTGFNDEVEAACCLRDTRKRKISEVGANPCGGTSNPGFSLESSSQYMSPTAPFLQAHMSMKQNPDTSLFGCDIVEDLPSLVCMGCVHCYMYILVSKSDTKCPKCKNIDLLDVSVLSHAMMKKAKEN